jgi:hypothetical protein
VLNNGRGTVNGDEHAKRVHFYDKRENEKYLMQRKFDKTITLGAREPLAVKTSFVSGYLQLKIVKLNS